MTVSQADKAEEYISYAHHCLRTSNRLADRRSRLILREMAAEWIKLATDAVELELTQVQETSRVKKYG